MAEYIVITKLQKEIDQTLRVAGMPDDWPAQTEEFNTEEAARANHPGKPLYKISDYKHFKAGLDMGHALLPKPVNPWWKFWSKK